jgi:hypothetical protein
MTSQIVPGSGSEPDEGLVPFLRVPLFLIALGTLFLLDDYAGWSVARTWPILLVFWGALLVASRRREA